MNRPNVNLNDRADAVSRSLGRHSIPLLRISLGLVFLGFGILKFFPGVSPAEGLATATVGKLTLGLVPPDPARLLVAALETAVGVLLISGLAPRLGTALLGLASVGILSPLVFFPSQLFAGPGHAPTLEGQYVIKDVVLLAAALVVAVGGLGRRTAVERGPTEPAGVRAARPAPLPRPETTSLEPAA